MTKGWWVAIAPHAWHRAMTGSDIETSMGRPRLPRVFQRGPMTIIDDPTEGRPDNEVISRIRGIDPTREGS